MNEANPVLLLPNPPQPGFYLGEVGLRVPFFEPPDASLPEAQQQQQLARALTQQLAGSLQLHERTQRLWALLCQRPGVLGERMPSVLEVLNKRRRLELERLVAQMSPSLGSTFLPLSEEVGPEEVADAAMLLEEAQELLRRYKEQQKVVQCSAWQAEAHAALELAQWLCECCQRLQQDTYFLESALVKARSALGSNKGRAAY